MARHETINYLELPAQNLAQTKAFFAKVFQWTFEDYGPDYIAFKEACIEGGFYKSTQKATTRDGSVLIVFYSDDLAATEEKILSAGGQIVRPCFQFPGGMRFHFCDPNGNEFAVWTET